MRSNPISFEYPHRRHWRFIEELHDPAQFFEGVFDQTTQGQGMALRHGDVYHVVDAQAELQVSFLIENQTVFSFYPYSEAGGAWPVNVAKEHWGPSPHEARVMGTCEGARVCLFDTLYFRNRVLYEQTGPHEFIVSGMCHALSPGEGEPFAQWDDVNHDEIDFRAVVRDGRRFRFWDTAMSAYDTTLVLPEGVELPVTLYAPFSIEGVTYGPGDVIEGHAWLFGQVPPREDDEAAKQSEAEEQAAEEQTGGEDGPS